MKDFRNSYAPHGAGNGLNVAEEITRHLRRLLIFESPRDSITILYGLERLKFLAQTEHRGTMEPSDARHLRTLEKEVEARFRRKSMMTRRAIRREVLAMTRRHVRAVRVAERDLHRGVLTRRRDALEFDHDVLYLRDNLEYIYAPLERLGYERTVSSSRSALMSVDPLLGILLVEGSPLYYQSGAYVAPEPSLFPNRFWWRRLAWRSFQPFRAVNRA